jgi:very-short-patch-repair endonuclease
MTEAEKKIWYRVRDKRLRVKFRRQQPIGNYVADFVCFEKKLVIEIDGGEHFERNRDKIRDKWFQEQGYKVLRFWNNDVLRNTDGVIQVIIKEISPAPLSPPLPSMSNLGMKHKGGEVIVDGGNWKNEVFANDGKYGVSEFPNTYKPA